MATHDYLQSPMFWLKRAYLSARKALDEGLNEHNLTGSQFEVLQHVLNEDGLEQRTLQDRLQIASATLTRLVDGLVSHGLVVRLVGADDARVKQLYATSQGRALEEDVRRKVAALEEQMLSGFSAAERALIQEYLRRLTANIGSEPDPEV